MINIFNFRCYMKKEDIDYIFNSITTDLSRVIDSVEGRTFGVTNYNDRLEQRLKELGLNKGDAEQFTPILRQCIDSYFSELDKARTPRNQTMFFNGNFVKGLMGRLYGDLSGSLENLSYRP